MPSTFETLVLKLKRGKGPFFQTARHCYRFYLTANLPMPNGFKPVGRTVYNLRTLIRMLWKRFWALVYLEPVFRSRCDSAGKRLSLVAMPQVSGHTSITLGDDVRLSGSLGIASGRVYDHPSLRIGNRVFIGHGVSITCNQQVVIEDDVLIAGRCFIADSDGHPMRMDQRIAGMPPDCDSIRPVRICKGAWVGYGSLILKGVTIGEGSIVGAHSVVTRDVPPFTVVGGVPARAVGKCDDRKLAPPATSRVETLLRRSPKRAGATTAHRTRVRWHRAPKRQLKHSHRPKN